MTENPENHGNAERQLNRLINIMKDIQNSLVILVWTMWFVLAALIAIAINVRGLK